MLHDGIMTGRKSAIAVVVVVVGVVAVVSSLLRRGRKGVGKDKAFAHSANIVLDFL